MLCGVAGSATYTCVLSIEGIAGLRVVESLCGGLPVNHLEVHAVVIGVAFHTGGSRGAVARERGVETSVGFDFVSDFDVAFSAAEGGRSRRDRVALGTVCVAAQALMRAGEGAGRDLRAGRRGMP